MTDRSRDRDATRDGSEPDDEALDTPIEPTTDLRPAQEREPAPADESGRRDDAVTDNPSEDTGLDERVEPALDLRTAQEREPDETSRDVDAERDDSVGGCDE